jgi:hypothetical protein
MELSDKLVSLGWITTSGESVDWFHWQKKEHRVAVSYWRESKRRLEPIFNIQAGYLKVRRTAAPPSKG